MTARSCLAQVRLGAACLLAVAGGACDSQTGKTRLSPGQIACVFGKDGGRIGTVVSARPASDGVNRIVTVALDSTLRQTRDVAVPTEGTVGPCGN
jgi:hypothetical protein